MLQSKNVATIWDPHMHLFLIASSWMAKYYHPLAIKKEICVACKICNLVGWGLLWTWQSRVKCGKTLTDGWSLVLPLLLQLCQLDTNLLILSNSFSPLFFQWGVRIVLLDNLALFTVCRMNQIFFYWRTASYNLIAEQSLQVFPLPTPVS